MTKRWKLEVLIVLTLFKNLHCFDVCYYLECGLNALKVVNIEDLSDCYCACPHNSQGDPLFECKRKQFGTIAAGGNTRFLVGKGDSESRWPWMTTLGFFGSIAWVHQCGGSLITHRHVLTAAHCTRELDKEKWRALVGAHNLENGERDNYVVRKILDFHIHPKFEEIEKASYYDVAILVLDKAIQFTDNIIPIKIPRLPIQQKDAFAGSSVTIMGWGNGTDKILKSDEIQVYKQKTCTVKYNAPRFGLMKAKIGSMIPLNFTNGLFCAGNPNGVESACFGDSGGPMVKFEEYNNETEETAHFVQIGVIQGGAKCGDKDLPGVFVSLTDESVLEFVTERSGLKRSNYWGPWSGYSPCSVSCGNGIQTRNRQCKNLSVAGGDTCEGPAYQKKQCNWGECGEEVFVLNYIAITLSDESYSGCDCKIFMQLTNPLTGETCITRRLNKPGNDWAKGTTDVWDNDFLGSCNEFTVTRKNGNLELDFLLSGYDHIQIDLATAGFKSKSTQEELKFQEFCIGWSGDDLQRTDHLAPMSSLLMANLEKNISGLMSSNKAMTWNEANEFCKSHQLKLVEVHKRCKDLKIQEFLKTTAPPGNNNKTFWLGLRYDLTSRGFLWNGRSGSLQFTKWDQNQWPTDFTKWCVKILELSSRRRWKNFSCSDNAFALCEARS